ncbi:MAG: DUF2321 domain-containing protein [Candidatus Dormibacterales bacterium]
MGEVYDIAQVCPNGHVATSMSQYGPQFRRDFCETCGEATITACPSCEHPIRGAYSGGIIGLPYRPPAFCPDCGKPFPWTERRLEAARVLAREAEHLSAEERTELAGTLDDLSRDVPRTQVAAIRFKRLVAKAGVGTANALRDVLVDVASEAAKKAIWG